MEKSTTGATLPTVGFKHKTDWQLRKDKDQITLQVVKRLCSKKYPEGKYKRPEWHKKVNF